MAPGMINEQPKQTVSEDQILLASMLKRYESELEGTHERVLERLKSNSLDLTELRDLTYRHALPFFATLDALNCQPRQATQVACGAILAYSIPLIAIDTELDGRPSTLRNESIWDQVKRPGVAQKITHLGYSDIVEGSESAIAVSLLSKVASDTISAMNFDAGRRGLSSQLETDRRFIEDYWNSPESRLRGSGIGRLMMGLGSILADGTVTDARDQFSITLGILRQLADELMDIEEDVLSGLVTLPLAYALQSPEVSDELTQMIHRVWRRDPGSSAQKQNFFEGNQLRELILISEGHKTIMHVADQLLQRARSISLNNFPRADRVDALLVHRRKQIDSAAANGLQDTSRPLRVDDLLVMK
jgi:hypothetical protein